MVGYVPDGLVGSPFARIFQTMPATVSALSGAETLANLIVDLQHCEGWTVRARMSRSLMRSDDPLVLLIFEDLTERLWTDDE